MACSSVLIYLPVLACSLPFRHIYRPLKSQSYSARWLQHSVCLLLVHCWSSFHSLHAQSITHSHQACYIRLFWSPSLSLSVPCLFVTPIACYNLNLAALDDLNTMLAFRSFTAVSTHYHTTHDLSHITTSHVLLVSDDILPWSYLFLASSSHRLTTATPLLQRLRPSLFMTIDLSLMSRYPTHHILSTSYPSWCDSTQSFTSSYPSSPWQPYPSFQPTHSLVHERLPIFSPRLITTDTCMPVSSYGTSFSLSMHPLTPGASHWPTYTTQNHTHFILTRILNVTVTLFPLSPLS